jgi:hypothetical protein
MNAINRAVSSIFDLFLYPIERLGTEVALILVSGLFGVLAMIAFKHISWQRGIKKQKDKIKGHMIAIRIYQDDLGIVLKSVGGVLTRNTKYVGLNLLPILPLLAPFTLVAAQLVTRYSFAPIPLSEVPPTGSLEPARGIVLEIAMKAGQEARVRDLVIDLPEGLTAVSPLVRSPRDGMAWLEVVAVRAGEWEIDCLIGAEPVGGKRIVTGDVPSRMMQPERVAGFWSSWLSPAEDVFSDSTPIARVAFSYPERDLRVLPGGPGGIIVSFFVSSILFGMVLLKPLNIQI